MKRFSFGVVAALMAVVLSFSGLSSAASSVDYEKSVGQVDGADTINWVVTATDDGGYVVGGQTLTCYRYPMPAAENSGLSFSEGVKVDFQECAKNASFIGTSTSSESNFNIDSFCLSGAFRGFGNMDADTGLTDDDDYTFDFSCVDYIAKFKKNGTKEWLTTIEDDSRPVAVNKLADGSYRMLVKDKRLYSFDTHGIQTARKELNLRFAKAYINSDGSVTSEAPLTYSDANGTVVTETTETGVVGIYSQLFPTKDGYVANKCWLDSEARKEICVIVDISKDISTITVRELKNINEDTVNVMSANENGDVLAYMNDNDGNITVVSIDKDGNSIGESDIIKNDNDLSRARFYKDFTIGFGDSVLSPVTKIVKLDRNLKVKYEYKSSGNEIINDVAVLKDKSLVGVGAAIKGSSSMPVVGDMNGGYLRLIAKQQDVPSERPVDNPKTWDTVDAVAMIGGIALLGLGVFLRKNLSRR